MAEYSVSLTGSLDFSPDSTVAEILQNVRMILSTRIGTVPLDRDFGVSWEMVDQPVDVAKLLIQAQVIEAIQQYEPRAEVTKVEFDTSDAMEGKLSPKVTVRIAG